MFVAAMLGAFPDLRDRVFSDIAAVLPSELGSPVLTPVMSNGIAAFHFSLPGFDETLPDHDHGHHHHHEHEHHEHEHRRHSHEHDHHGHHHHEPGHGPSSAGPSVSGHYADIRRRIASAALSEGASEQALAILALLAESESRIHGVSLDEVHFHEIAGWDSLMDVVAAGSLIAAVSPAEWSVAALPLGGGMVRTMHGPLAVPAPATAALLEGYRWRDDGVMGERVTPTGAAIIRHLTGGAPHAGLPDAILNGSGYGAGTKNLPGIANVLRVLVFEKDAPDGNALFYDEHIAVLSFDIDDMSGEEIAQSANRLRLCDGVRDLVLEPIYGKKGRPATTFRLLVREDAFDAVARAVFEETTTLGIRWHTAQRRVLRREGTISPGGVRLKRAFRPDGTVTVKAESDDLSHFNTLAKRRAAQRDEEKP